MPAKPQPPKPDPKIEPAPPTEGTEGVEKIEPAGLDLFDRIAAKWDEVGSDPFAHAEGADAVLAGTAPTIPPSLGAAPAPTLPADDLEPEDTVQLPRAAMETIHIPLGPPPSLPPTKESLDALDPGSAPREPADAEEINPDAQVDLKDETAEELDMFADDEEDGVRRDELSALFEGDPVLPATGEEPIDASLLDTESPVQNADLTASDPLPGEETDAAAPSPMPGLEPTTVELPPDDVIANAVAAAHEPERSQEPASVAAHSARRAAFDDVPEPTSKLAAGTEDPLATHRDMPQRVAALVDRAARMGREATSPVPPVQMAASLREITERDVHISELNARIAELERKLGQATSILRQLETAYMVGMRSKRA